MGRQVLAAAARAAAAPTAAAPANIFEGIMFNTIHVCSEGTRPDANLHMYIDVNSQMCA